LFGPVESGKGDDFDLSQLKALLQVTLVKKLNKKEFLIFCQASNLLKLLLLGLLE
jgi:hypothetical protein